MIIEKLKHNLFLCKKNFNRFVECFNDVVDRVCNLKGDGDLNPDDGYIKVDYTNDLNPIIRFNSMKLLKDRDSTDTEVSQNELSGKQESIDSSYLSSCQRYFHLYKFGDDERTDISTALDMSSDIVLRTRDLSGNVHIDYLALSGLSSAQGSAYYADSDSLLVPTGLSSIEKNTTISGENYFSLYGFGTSQAISSKWVDRGCDFVVRKTRPDGTKQLEYYSLSGLSDEISGDTQADVGLSSIELVKGEDGEKWYQLHGFDKYTADGTLCVEVDDDNIRYLYWGQGEYKNQMTVSNAKQHLLVKDKNADDSAKVLKYMYLYADLPPFIHGDADQFVRNNVSSHSIDFHPSNDLNKSHYLLHNFDETSADTSITISASEQQIIDWMSNGGTQVSCYDDLQRMPHVLVRYRDLSNDINILKYGTMAHSCMPFVHGDADEYIGGQMKSIEHHLNPNDLTKTYYQLHDWYSPDIETKSVDLMVQDVTPLLPDGEAFLVRDQNGVLKYATIETSTELTGMKVDINFLLWHLDVMSADLSTLNEWTAGLSARMGDFWRKGGDYTTNYCYSAIINTLNTLNITAETLYASESVSADYGKFNSLDVSTLTATAGEFDRLKVDEFSVEDLSCQGLTADAISCGGLRCLDGTIEADTIIGYSTIGGGIASFEAASINSCLTCYGGIDSYGTINTTDINATNANLSNVASQAIDTTNLSADYAKIYQAVIDHLSAQQFEIDDFTANDISCQRFIASQADIEEAWIPELNTQNLTASTANTESLSANDITAAELTANDIVAEELTSTWIINTNLRSENLSSTSGLFFGNISSASGSFGSVSSTSGSFGSLRSENLSSTSGQFGIVKINNTSLNETQLIRLLQMLNQQPQMLDDL